MAVSIKHDPEGQEFTTEQGNYSAELAYSRPAPEVIDFNHTFVDEGLRGQGVAEQLARAALAYAQENHLKVKTSCEFMAGFVQRNPEYQSMLA